LTEANLLLLREETLINEQFESSVKDMTDKGWEEIVARQVTFSY
jgi:hypothetical protein